MCEGGKGRKEVDWVHSLSGLGMKNTGGRAFFKGKKINLLLNLLGFKMTMEYPSVVSASSWIYEFADQSDTGKL